MLTYSEMARDLFSWALDNDENGEIIGLVNKFFDLEYSYERKATAAKRHNLSRMAHEISVAYHRIFA